MLHSLPARIPISCMWAYMLVHILSLLTCYTILNYKQTILTTVTFLVSSIHCNHVHNPIPVIFTTTILFFFAHADDSRHKHWVQCVYIKNTVVLTLVTCRSVHFWHDLLLLIWYESVRDVPYRYLVWPCFYILSWSSVSHNNKGYHPCLNLSAFFWLLRVVAASCFPYELRMEINNLSKRNPDHPHINFLCWLSILWNAHTCFSLLSNISFHCK